MASNSLAVQAPSPSTSIGGSVEGNTFQSGIGGGNTEQAEEVGYAQFITFTVGAQKYGVDIMSVREIKGWVDTTLLPNTPDYMRGVLNLRGIIVPIFDLRSRFGLGQTEATTLHVIVIIAVKERMVGILVDTVSDILTVPTTDIRSVPKMENLVEEEYLSGLVTIEERMVALLNQERLFESAAIEAGVAAGQSGTPVEDGP